KTRGRARLGPRGGLRLRLWLDPDCDKLSTLWWEALLDPERDEPLAINVAFSRFLRVDQPRGWPVRERPLRLLLVACSPLGLEKFGLPDIDVYLEYQVLKEATAPMAWLLQVDRLVGRPTL